MRHHASGMAAQSSPFPATSNKLSCVNLNTWEMRTLLRFRTSWADDSFSIPGQPAAFCNTSSIDPQSRIGLFDSRKISSRIVWAEKFGLDTVWGEGGHHHHNNISRCYFYSVRSRIFPQYQTSSAFLSENYSPLRHSRVPTPSWTLA